MTRVTLSHDHLGAYSETSAATIVRSRLAGKAARILLDIGASSAYANSRCGCGTGKTPEQLFAIAHAWLRRAKGGIPRQTLLRAYGALACPTSELHEAFKLLLAALGATVLLGALVATALVSTELGGPLRQITAAVS